MFVQLEVAFKNQAFPMAYELWDLIYSKLYSHESVVIDGFTGKQINFSDVSDFLRVNKKDSFLFEVGEGSIEFGFLADLEFSRLDFKNMTESISEAELWLCDLINNNNFIQARVYDYEYDLWQNMKDISYFESEGKGHKTLPKLSNGLPFPLTSEVIDTSMNPGRWSLKHGYIESVGSIMLLGKKFLGKRGVDLDSASLKEHNITVQELDNVWRIQALDKCFTKDSGEEAELQNNLRNIIFDA